MTLKNQPDLCHTTAQLAKLLFSAKRDKYRSKQSLNIQTITLVDFFNELDSII